MKGEIETSRQLFSLDCSRDTLVCSNPAGWAQRALHSHNPWWTFRQSPLPAVSAKESGNGKTLGEDLCQSGTDLALKLVVAKIKIHVDLQMIYSECPLLFSLREAACLSLLHCSCPAFWSLLCPALCCF